MIAHGKGGKCRKEGTGGLERVKAFQGVAVVKAEQASRGNGYEVLTQMICT